MKEVTYEEWQKNPKPRMMWVWDYNEEEKVKRKVVYIDAKNKYYPVITVHVGYTLSYKHCAEIEEIEEPKYRRMTKQELAWWLQDGIKEGKHREWKYIYGSVVFNFGSFNYQIDEGSSLVNSAILIRENDEEWHEPLVEV